MGRLPTTNKLHADKTPACASTMSSAKRKADAMASTAAAADATDAPGAPPKGHVEIMEACAAGELATLQSLLDAADAPEGDGKPSHDGDGGDVTTKLGSHRHLLAAWQDPTTGMSPLMAAAQRGHPAICQALLDAGAPWNAVDRCGKCAGDHATTAEKWEVVNLLVDAGTKAELILGASIRLARQMEQPSSDATKKDDGSNDSAEEPGKGPVSHEPCTKPDYLEHSNVRYNAANTLLLDDDDDAVMMEWERPLMHAHANILTHNGTKGKRVLNIGFGLGIVDAALQSYEPSLHVIIEAHPTVYKKMIADGWDKENVRICFGRWQDELPKLVEEGLEFDGIFYDTYGEHFTDLEDFHQLMAKVLHKPDGVYSFFNGLAPDNLFFHGVACNCVKIQLSHLALDAEFAQCEIQVKEKEWEGVRRKYWHGRNTYYLPIVTWKKSEEEKK